MPEAFERTTIRRDCWHCGRVFIVDLEEVQQDRKKYYSVVKAKPKEPERYYIKCTYCGRHNSVLV